MSAGTLTGSVAPVGGMSNLVQAAADASELCDGALEGQKLILLRRRGGGSVSLFDIAAIVAFVIIGWDRKKRPSGALEFETTY